VGWVSDLIERAEAALRRLDGAAALAVYREPANGTPEDQIQAGRIRALWLLRRWDEARDVLVRLRHGHPRSPHTAIASGIIALGQPDVPSFIGVTVGSALRDDYAAIAAFTEAVRLGPTRAVAVAGLATALRMADRVDDAMALLDQQPMNSNDILLARAAVHLDRGHYDQARAALDTAVAADPEDYRAAGLRIELDLHEYVDLVEAGAKCESLIASTDSRMAYLIELHGWVNEELAETRSGAERKRLLVKADDLFARSIEVGPATPGGFGGRAEVAELRGQSLAAIAYLHEGLALEPSSPQLSLKLAELELSESGATAEQRHQRYAELLSLDRRYLQPRIMMAYALDELRRTGEARQLLSAVTATLPDQRQLILTNAWLDLHDGHLERGLAGFRRLNRIDQDAIAGEVGALRLLGAIEQAEALAEQTIAKQPAGGAVADVRREYAYCAMHEGRYRHAAARARQALDVGLRAGDIGDLVQAATSRSTNKWWRPYRADNDRAVEIARTDDVRARLREEVIPERVRERTLGRLRTLEWELAKLRVAEEKAGAQRSIRVTRVDNLAGGLVIAVLLTAPWSMSQLLSNRQVTWWAWVVVAGAGFVTAAIAVDMTRGRLISTSILEVVITTVYLWWRDWQVTNFWELLLIAGIVLPTILVNAWNLIYTLSDTAAARINVYDLDVIDSPLRRGQWRRRHAVLRRRFPFASMLLDLEELAILLADEHALATAGARERCSRLFESVASAADHLIRRARAESLEDESHPDPWLFQPRAHWVRGARLRPLGGIPDALLEQRLNRCAASVVTQLRQYKRQVLLPADGTWTALRQEVLNFATLACERRWDSLPQPEPEKVARRFRARVAVSLRMVLIAAAGPAALVAYQVLPGARPAVPDVVAFILYVIWPLFTVLLRVDPDLVTKVNLLSQWLPGSGKGGSDGQAGPPRR
jgi:tetratricopeptide (TPR) repeat protein